MSIKIVSPVRIRDGKCDQSGICKNTACPYYATDEELNAIDDKLAIEATMLPRDKRQRVKKREFLCDFLESKQARETKEAEEAVRDEGWDADE